jgi:hypothetical protein
VSSGQGQAESAEESPVPLPDRLPQLGRLHDLLHPVDEKPDRLDASHEEAHRLVREIWDALFGEQGLLKAPDYNASRTGLKAAWDEENDQYETYAYTLEIYQKRQKKDLNADEARKDKKPLVEERRSYISKLRAFHGFALGASRAI